MFSNILTLLEVNEKLLEELKGSGSTESESEDESETETESNKKKTLGNLKSVSEAFRNYTPYLKLYSTYASGYQQADTLLQVYND